MFNITAKTAAQVVMPSSCATTSKAKRVRTGCLTCRERHLKCDERFPDCLNCHKSNRQCKRGVRLNFLNATVHSSTQLDLPRTWTVEFQDESRDIASAYRGGLGLYKDQFKPSVDPQLADDDPESASRPRSLLCYDSSLQTELDLNERETKTTTNGAVNSSTPVPPLENVVYDAPVNFAIEHISKPQMEPCQTSVLHALSNDEPGLSSMTFLDFPAHHNVAEFQVPGLREDSLAPLGIFQEISDNSSMGDDSQRRPSSVFETSPPPAEGYVLEVKDYIGSEEELWYIKNFSQKVGVWMDAFDENKYFSNTLPCEALDSSMLLNAALACGVKQATLKQPLAEEKAQLYYDTAAAQLVRSLQNPDRNMGECAKVALLLNIFEFISDRPTYRMNHVAGARALIRECQWNARSMGSGAACFWLNIAMEVLNCLLMNWLLTWEPDLWGIPHLPPNESREDAHGTQETAWLYRMFYVIAKIADFRATDTQFENLIPHGQVRLASRLTKWHELRQACNDWNDQCPRSMHPVGYLLSTDDNPFPTIWLITSPALVGRLFYHTAQCLLAQTHPTEPAKASADMRWLERHHCHQICGIVAGMSKVGPSMIAARCMAITAPALTQESERLEALKILENLEVKTEWPTKNISMEIRRAWGWEKPKPTMLRFDSHRQLSRTTQIAQAIQGQKTPREAEAEAGSTPLRASGNPLRSADFSLPDHPYQNWYEPPSRPNDHT